MKLRILLVLVSLLASLGLGELAARFTLNRSPGSGFADAAGWYDFHVRLTKWEGGNFLRDLEPHPYFGFVMKQEGTAANNFGFNDPVPYPYEKKSPNEYVVAVLGGSVALGWGGWIQNLGKDYFITELKKRVPALARRDIVILDMAMGGYKQPQQFFIASYFADSVDLFINLEGYNELFAYANQPVFPVDYPVGSYLYFSAGRAAVEASRTLRWLSALNYAVLSAGHGHGLLRRSALYFSVAKAVFTYSTNRSIEVAEAAKLAFRKELEKPGRAFYSEAARARDPLAEAVGSWERYVARESAVVKAAGKKVIFFLQPNQYLVGSKPLSDWEQQNAINNDFVNKARSYPLLPPAVKRMRARGLNAHDLTMVFEKEKETTYADNCCHLNAFGNKLLTSAITAKIAESLKLP